MDNQKNEIRMLIDLKRKIIATALRAEKDGLCRQKSGNFSICIRDEKKILITPSGVYREELTPDDIVVADFDGNIIENINDRKASTELMMHIAIYKSRSDVAAVVHTHSIYASAFAVAGIKISPVVTEAAFYGEVGLVEYAEAGSKELAENVKEPIKKADVCLLKNHGVVTVADTIENALLKAFYVEDVAKIEILSKLLSNSK